MYCKYGIFDEFRDKYIHINKHKHLGIWRYNIGNI